MYLYDDSHFCSVNSVWNFISVAAGQPACGMRTCLATPNCCGLSVNRRMSAGKNCLTESTAGWMYGQYEGLVAIKIRAISFMPLSLGDLSVLLAHPSHIGLIRSAQKVAVLAYKFPPVKALTVSKGTGL